MRISDWSSDVCSADLLFPDFNGNVERLLHVQKKYKTMWELPQNLFIKMAAERARYICPSHSTNLYFRYPELGDLRKAQLRSEARRGGQRCVRRCRYGWLPEP